MQIIKRVGKWWVEIDRPEIERDTMQIMWWLGIMPTILNILAAIIEGSRH
jgi:hypothetical protein